MLSQSEQNSFENISSTLEKATLSIMQNMNAIKQNSANIFDAIMHSSQTIKNNIQKISNLQIDTANYYELSQITSLFGKEEATLIEKINEILSFASNDTIETINIFNSHYSIESKKSISNISDSIKAIGNQKQKMNSAQSKCGEYAKRINSRADYINKIQPNEITQEITKPYFDDCVAFKSLEVEYTKAVEEANRIIKLKSPEFVSSLEMLEQLDESSSTFLQNYMLKIPKYVKQCANIVLAHYTEIEEKISGITKLSPKKKINNLMYKDLLLILSPIEKYNLECKQLNISLQKDSSNAPDKNVIAAYKACLENIPINQSIISCISDSNSIIPVRSNIIEICKKQKPQTLANAEAFISLTEFTNQLLSSYGIANDKKEELYYLLVSAHQISYSENGKSTHLFLQIADNKLWQDPKVWEGMIESMMHQKILEIESTINNRRKLKQGNTGYFGFFEKGIESLKNKMLGIEYTAEEFAEIDRHKVNSLNNIIQDLIFYMASCKINKEILKFLITKLSSEYGLSKKDISAHLLQLECYQESTRKYNSIKYLEYFPIKMNGKTPKYYSIIKAHKYLPITDVINIQMINKYLMSTNVHTMQLLKNLYMPIDKRRQLWKKLLKFDKYSFKEYVISKTTAIDKSVTMEENADIIKVDVQRSYLNIQNITHINSVNFIESMRIVLLVYSFYDQTVGYCQGMNYIVGFLLNIFPQEGEAFYALRQLMELSKMRCLFKKETPLLQQLFYIVKKLIAKHMPELYKHMDSEGVEVSFFAASWIVTLFSNALQYPKVDTIPPLLLFIWEQFISHGWKSVAKIIIAFLKYYETNLINLKFDKIIMHLNEKCSDLVLTFDNKVVEQILSIYSTIKIKGVNMYTLESEYISISGIAEAESPARQKIDLNKGDLLIEL